MVLSEDVCCGCVGGRAAGLQGARPALLAVCHDVHHGWACELLAGVLVVLPVRPRDISNIRRKKCTMPRPRCGTSQPASDSFAHTCAHFPLLRSAEHAADGHWSGVGAT